MSDASASAPATTSRSPAIEAYRAAFATGDPERVAEAALALPTNRGFGTHPGQIPGLLHEALTLVTEAGAAARLRARLTTKLARAWVYGGEANLGRRCADEALHLVAGMDDPVVVADALDAALLVRWGPDDFDERRRLATRLVEVTGQASDAGVRLPAHLWRLTVAWECLDMVAVQRQLRALDLLAEEAASDRVAFFATSRRAMHALTLGDPEAAQQLIARTVELGHRLDEPDVQAVTHSLQAGFARLTDDLVALADEAAAFEAFGRAEGIASVSAEAGVLWLAAGHPDRAAAVVRHVAGSGLDTVPRDVDFLLTVSSVTSVAAALHLDELTAEGVALLEPCAGRAVINAGSVSFHGVVDDHVHRAHRALGRIDPSRWHDRAASAYQRIGARWWAARLEHEPGATTARVAESPVRRYRLHRHGTGVWSVGDADAPTVLPDMRGLEYLRQLVSRPGVMISALTMSEQAEGHAGSGVVQPTVGEALDQTALRAYRRRIEQLDDTIDAATLRGDDARRSHAESERTMLIDHLAAATGLGSRPRRVGANDERARVAVRKAIATALNRIEQHEPSMGQLLRRTVRTGAQCAYEPDTDLPVAWITTG